MRARLQFLLPLLFALGSLPARGAEPYKFVIAVDSASAERATQIISFLKGTAPFSEMGNQISFETITLTDDEMNCSNRTPDSPRIISCDTSHIWKEASKLGANRCIIVTNKGTGGSGGNPLIVGLDYPVNTVLHELIHSYGFGDEYQYSPEEAKLYGCDDPKHHAKDANLAMIMPHPPYAGDADARARHSGQIPWYGTIATSTLITTGSQLGTAPGVFPKDAPALYPGGDCEGVYPTWKPFYADTIMKSLGTNWVPPLYQQIIVRQMSAEIGSPITLIQPACAQCNAAAAGPVNQ